VAARSSFFTFVFRGSGFVAADVNMEIICSVASSLSFDNGQSSSLAQLVMKEPRASSKPFA
jgi:hypothetical protein